jgi:hypothetical protein
MNAVDLNEFEIMADNVLAFEVFRRVQTQWRTTFSALLGLDYGVVIQVMELVGVPADQKLDCLDRIRVMESGYKEVVNK